MHHRFAAARHAVLGRRAVLGIILGVIASLVVTLAAIAYWRNAGTGSGSASTGTLQTVTVTGFVGGDSNSSFLVPGGNADVILRVNNPNTYPVTLVTVAANGTITPDGPHSTCTTGVTFTNQTGLTITLPPGKSLVDLSGAASMSAGASNGCQAATFVVPVAITVHKV